MASATGLIVLAPTRCGALQRSWSVPAKLPYPHGAAGEPPSSSFAGCLNKHHPGAGDIRTWWRATSLTAAWMLDEQDQAVWLCTHLPCNHSHTLPCEIARPLLPVSYGLVYFHICSNSNAQCPSSDSTEDGITRMLEAATAPT
jgi:hypothetical protein